MKLTLNLSKSLAAAATAGFAIASCAACASAVTVRDHRGQPSTPQVQQTLPCSSFKYCAKQGVIVRDHRTGATPGGK